MIYEHMGVLLLAGGKNRRMQGRRKADLEVGQGTILDHLMEVFASASLPHMYLSVADSKSWPGDSCPLIEDEIPGQGPLGGIVSAFHAVPEKECFFVCATDMPGVNVSAVIRLCGLWEGEKWDCPVVAETSRHIHPLFGIYPRKILSAAEKMLAEGDRRMMHLLKETGAQKVFFEDEAVFANINTPAQYDALKHEKNLTEGAGVTHDTALKDPRIIAVAGAMGSGKTTLIEKLISELKKRGHTVAAIKHDGHDFDCDREGTDSDRFDRAGAYGTAVFSATQMFFRRRTDESQEEKLKELIRHFPEADIILLEGAKDKPFSKIETRRAGERCVSNPEGRFYVAEMEDGTFSQNEIRTIADRVEAVLKQREEAQNETHSDQL